MPRDLSQPEARQSVGLTLRASIDTFDGCVPLLDPIEHMCPTSHAVQPNDGPPAAPRSVAFE